MGALQWRRVIVDAADLGVRMVQFIGGEPTLHTGLPYLVVHALSRGMKVEVFSNLVHVTHALWELFTRPGVSLATSYYSDDPRQHQEITGRPTYERTKANIAKARRLGIEVRAGVIDLGDGQRVAQARNELVSLGIPNPGYDRVRALGRAAADQKSTAAAALCGACGVGKAVVRADGSVAPCSMANWVTVGNVQNAPLAAILAGMPEIRAGLTADGMPANTNDCTPTKTGQDCYPHNR
jgi:MoaA/NifB/PqqE/SkfB family radical SAM enzyme